MKDARHPKEYPRGPKVQMTPEWKELVRQRLAANKRTGKSPASRKELARIIGADPAGLGRALEGGQVTSKYASEICSVLEIETPTVPNPAVDVDEWDRIVAYMRALPRERQEHALRVLRTFLGDLDSK